METSRDDQLVHMGNSVSVGDDELEQTITPCPQQPGAELMAYHDANVPSRVNALRPPLLPGLPSQIALEIETRSAFIEPTSHRSSLESWRASRPTRSQYRKPKSYRSSKMYRCATPVESETAYWSLMRDHFGARNSGKNAPGVFDAHGAVGWHRTNTTVPISSSSTRRK